MTANQTGTVFDNFERPPCADLLGWTLLGFDLEAKTARMAFEARPEFLNPAGFVQGGLLAAMLDDTMRPTVLLVSEGRLYTVTVDMNVSFLAPARSGRMIGEGRIVQMGKTIAFLEATPSDEAGTVMARATSTARLVPVEKLGG